MSTTLYLGVVEQGKIRLCDEVELEENTQVYVMVPGGEPIPRVRSPRLANSSDLDSFAKQVIKAQPDAEL